ncbi:AAA family ATPase [Corynebacterium sp. zg254]|uniref:AAA family ATPase n=1 Tax=Corynebacterium zhongnanshanii TaxID=2768834 RepID=A0ABQ6VCG9_9CORY|nr:MULTISPECIES: AAA family ATPase [Corynebacterium]KAB3519911.1 AAA family ATPase [Corynebacterium zhongnanshanii]MCR5914858.1 AAA family ATPase [Corynebacterium sp. zg254]
MTTNPFRPTFGISPRVWRGRGLVLHDFEQAIAGEPGSPARALVIDGARGIGKTALVNELVDIAQSAGWVSLRTQSLQPTATLELRLRELIQELEPHGTGVLITIDEVQDANPADLAEIAGAYQMLLQDEKHIALIVTGLSEGVQRLLSLPGTTFMRRAQRFTLGGLTRDDAEYVLRETCSGSGIEFTDDAAVKAALLSRGYPYLVQLVGFLAWKRAHSHGQHVINTEAVDAIRADAIQTLGEQVHEPSIKGLPARQKEFLQCMAATAQATVPATGQATAQGDMSDAAERAEISEIAACMGRAVTSMSDLRQRLIDKELIEPVDRGLLEFTLPYLGEYLRNQPSRRRVS